MTDWLNMILEDRVDPTSFHQTFPWAEAMIGCPHDSVYHAEGDPWIHTCMVVDELARSPAYLDMSDDRKCVLRLAAWLHDIAKPATTEISWDEKEQRERVGQPGHAPLGAAMAYQALIDAGADIRIAREVHALIFWHMRPDFLLMENSRVRRAIQYSIDAGRGSWLELLTLCRADNRGRISVTTRKTIENFDRLELALEDMSKNIDRNLLHRPWPFETEEARLSFFRGSNQTSAFHMPENPTEGRMILLSGLPGAGKDTVIRSCFPDMNVVSLDDIRGQMNVGWKSKQGQVLQAGLEAARVEMRSKRDFIWNATCITRKTRQKIIGLARDYNYLIEALSIDIPLSEVMRRNRMRDRAVPDNVMETLGQKREPIIANEVHILSSLDAQGNITEIFGRPVPEPVNEPEGLKK